MAENVGPPKLGVWVFDVAAVMMLVAFAVRPVHGENDDGLRAAFPGPANEDRVGDQLAVEGIGVGVREQVSERHAEEHWQALDKMLEVIGTKLAEESKAG